VITLDQALSNGNDNILQEIYTSGDPNFSSIVFQNNNLEATCKELTTNKNNIYQFWLTNEDNEEMKLNGQNVVLSLVLFRRNNIYDMIKGFIKYLLNQN